MHAIRVFVPLYRLVLCLEEVEYQWSHKKSIFMTDTEVSLTDTSNHECKIQFGCYPYFAGKKESLVVFFLLQLTKFILRLRNS